MIGELIGAGGQLVGSGLNAYATIQAQKMQNRSNMKLAEYAYNKDLEQWNRQNAHNLQMWDLQNNYNSPDQQMRRYQAAGLNPNLVVGGASSGNAGGVNTSQMSSYNAPTMQFNNPLPILLDTLQQFADLDIKQATSNKIKQESEAVANANELTAIQKQYWVKNELNKANMLYNQGNITARQYDRLQKEFEEDFNAKLDLRSNGDYIWSFGENSYSRLRKRDELNKSQAEVTYMNLRNSLQEKINKFYDSNKIIQMIGNLVGTFK